MFKNEMLKISNKKRENKKIYPRNRPTSVNNVKYYFYLIPFLVITTSDIINIDFKISVKEVSKLL